MSEWRDRLDAAIQRSSQISRLFPQLDPDDLDEMSQEECEAYLDTVEMVAAEVRKQAEVVGALLREGDDP